MNIKLKIFYLTFFIASIGLSKTYYIDSIIGSDSNSGLNPKFPWKTIEKINTHNFVPGDSLLFRTGLKWRGELNIKGIGTESKPIIISSYGTGIKPVIMGSEIAGEWEKISQNISLATVY